jgi:Outer membrane protein beta-barrel domain
MLTAYLRNQFGVSGRKGLIFVFLLVSTLAFSQKRSVETNLPNYDERWIHYGFLIGGHRTHYQLKYSDNFIRHQLDSIQSIMTPSRLGFDLGFIVNMRLSDFFDLRATPKVGFYEYKVEYNMVDGSQLNELVESTVVDIPLLIKYKSRRWTNTRIYMIGGIMPGIQASGNKKDENERKLQTADFNLSAEFGFGFDFYFPLFKFSPEIRFSRGLLNLLREDRFGYSEGIESLQTNVFTLYLLFE